MTTRLFGTDGIRGRAFEPPLDQPTVARLGRALAQILGAPDTSPGILLAGDTRASTEDLARWLAGAFCRAGGEVTWAGVLPTPAVSHLLRIGQWQAGVVISASHNPACDNGIKVLSRTGEKIADRSERRIEEHLAAAEDAPTDGPDLPPAERTLAERYVEIVTATHRLPRPLDSLHVVIDAAHGAASGLAGEALTRLGARVHPIASSPDGANINDGVGATAPARLQAEVTAVGADAGIALDGDADRALLVDHTGRVLDGDDILLVWARDLAARNALPARTVVATVMSNLGLQRGLEQEGLELVRCPVGDRSVWLAMQEHGAALGGEQSGHVICGHHSVSGDGLITASQVLAIAAASGRPLADLADLVRLPQVLRNVPVVRREEFDRVAAIQDALDVTRHRLGGRGRVLLRYSGTEPLARVMIEGDDEGEILQLADSLADTIRSALG